MALEPSARADQFRTARVRRRTQDRANRSPNVASRAALAPLAQASCGQAAQGGRFQFSNLVHDRGLLVSISCPLSTNPPLGSRQSAAIGVTPVARPRRQPLGRGLTFAGERAPEIDLGDRGRVVQTEGRSIQTAPPRTRPARPDCASAAHLRTAALRRHVLAHGATAT